MSLIGSGDDADRAAIDAKILTVNRVSQWAGQKSDEIGNFFTPHDAANGDVSGDMGFDFSPCGPPAFASTAFEIGSFDLRGEDKTRRYQVDPNTSAGNFTRQADRHGGQCALGGVVVRHDGIGSCGADRSEIQNPAPSACSHQRQQATNQPLGAEDVFFVGIDPGGTVTLLPVTGVGSAIVVHENIHVIFKAGIDELLSTSVGTDVPGDCNSGTEFCNSCARLICGEPVHENGCVLAQQVASDDETGAAMATGNDGRVAGEFKIHAGTISLRLAREMGALASTLLYSLRMDLPALILFLVCALVGSYVQAITGFAMGLLMIAIMGASGLVPISEVTAAVSIIAFVNVVLSLRGRVGHLHRGLFGRLIAGQMCAIGGGLWLLTVLDRDAEQLLGLLLGSFITAGALAMLLRPSPRTSISQPLPTFIAGSLGGLLAGLFAASGPVLGWFVYRQPLQFDAIRTTLLACFAITTSLRTVLVGVSGGLTDDVLLQVAVAIPVVFLGTWVGRHLPPPWSDAAVRRFAFAILLVAGLWILGNAMIS